MTLDQDLRLLDWTGRQLRKDKAGSIPAEFDSLLERLDCRAASRQDYADAVSSRIKASICSRTR